MKATGQMGAPNTQKFASYSCGFLQIVEGEARTNYDIRRPEKVAEFREVCGRHADEAMRILIDRKESPFYL